MIKKIKKKISAILKYCQERIRMVLFKYACEKEIRQRKKGVERKDRPMGEGGYILFKIVLKIFVMFATTNISILFS